MKRNSDWFSPILRHSLFAEPLNWNFANNSPFPLSFLSSINFIFIFGHFETEIAFSCKIIQVSALTQTKYTNTDFDTKNVY